MSVLPSIEEEFVATGRAKVEVRPIAILGEESELAAQAAACANDQDRFWQYHDTLYANQVSKHNVRAFSLENLKRFAEALAMDTTAFNSCLDSAKYASTVKIETDAALQQGISKTPTIFVNGREVSGTVDDIRSAIMEELDSGS